MFEITTHADYIGLEVLEHQVKNIAPVYDLAQVGLQQLGMTDSTSRFIASNVNQMLASNPNLHLILIAPQEPLVTSFNFERRRIAERSSTA